MIKNVLFFLLSWTSLSLGYHQQYLFLSAPEQLFFKQTKVGIEHRFLAEPLQENGLFGTEYGANVLTYIAVGVGYNQTVSFEISDLYDQQILQYKKSFFLTQNKFGFQLGVLRYNEVNQATVTSYITSLSYARDYKQLSSVINLIYDTDNASFHTGIGFVGKWTDTIHTVVDYVTPDKSQYDQGQLSLSLKWMTIGHNFIGFISNQNETGIKSAYQGVERNEFYVGFKLERLFDF